MPIRNCTLPALAALAAMAASAAFVQTVAGATIPTRADFRVGATVQNGCLVSTAPAQVTGVVFGQIVFSGISALVTGAQTVAVGAAAQLQCTTGANVRLTLDGGQHAFGTQRRLSNGTAFLPYTVSLTTAGNLPLLPGVEVGIAIGATPQALPLQASILLPGTGLPAGLYTDTVQVTVEW